MKNFHIDKETVINNIHIIIETRMTWKESVERFHLHNGDIQRIYMRYIVLEYGYMTAVCLANDNSM